MEKIFLVHCVISFVDKKDAKLQKLESAKNCHNCAKSATYVRCCEKENKSIRLMIYGINEFA